MEFVVVRDDRPDDTVLGVHGELDIASAQVLRHEVQQALTAAPRRIYLDLTGTTFIDSSGCRELLATSRAGSAAGSAVELVIPAENTRVRWVVEFMRFDAVLPVRDHVPSA